VKARRARYTPEAAERIRKLHPLIKKEVREGIRVLLDNPLLGYALHTKANRNNPFTLAPAGGGNPASETRSELVRA
jgi:hypothetical protein